MPVDVQKCIVYSCIVTYYILAVYSVHDKMVSVCMSECFTPAWHGEISIAHRVALLPLFLSLHAACLILLPG